jgi:hypothetical protein
MIVGVYLRLSGEREYPSISGGAKKRAKLRALPELPRQGVLTPAASDQKNIHLHLLAQIQ